MVRLPAGDNPMIEDLHFPDPQTMDQKKWCFVVFVLLLQKSSSVKSEYWNMPKRNWESALHQFAVISEDRMPTIWTICSLHKILYTFTGKLRPSSCRKQRRPEKRKLRPKCIKYSWQFAELVRYWEFHQLSYSIMHKP